MQGSRGKSSHPISVAALSLTPNKKASKVLRERVFSSVKVQDKEGRALLNALQEVKYF